MYIIITFFLLCAWCSVPAHYYGALPVPYVSVHTMLWSHIGTLMCLLALEPHMTAIFIHLPVSLGNDLGDIFDGVGLVDFKSRGNDFLLA